MLYLPYRTPNTPTVWTNNAVSVTLTAWLPGISAHRRRLATVGLIGNRMVMDTRAYGRITAAQVLLPDEPAREAVHRAYVEMAVPGRVTPAQREVFFAAGRTLMARGAEAIVLGGTDLFLAFDNEDSGFATLDCARVHVEAILARAFAEG